MRKLFSLSLVVCSSTFAAIFPWDPVTPTIATMYGTGPTVTWFHDAAYTQPATPGALQGQTLYGVLSAPATVTTYGRFNGALYTIDSTHIKYTAPTSFLPVNPTYGLQVMPNDEIFYTRIDSLPAVSSHYEGDGSGYCENGGKADIQCEGDPTQGTGIYTNVGPVNSNCGTGLGLTADPGGTDDCHAVNNIQYFQNSPEYGWSFVDGSYPRNKTYTNRYGGTFSGFPNVDYRFTNGRQQGTLSNQFFLCTGEGLTPPDFPNPPYSTCATNGSPFTPFPTSGVTDYHVSIMDPTVTLGFWEVFNDVLFGNGMFCNGVPHSCNASSSRQMGWNQYAGNIGGMSATGTPVMATAMSGEDLWRAADGNPIQHSISYTIQYNCARGGPGNTDVFVWPAQGPMSCYSSGNLALYGTRPFSGARARLSPTRAAFGGVLSIAETNAGSGYKPGAVIQGIISGCASIDGTHQPMAIAPVGKSGAAAGMYIVNTGKACSNPTIKFPDPPSGTTMTATVFAPPWSAPGTDTYNVEQALFNRSVQYGYDMNDIGYTGNYRQETGLANSPYYGLLGKFDGSFGNPYLYDYVDATVMSPPTSSGFPSNMKPLSWIADSNNPTEGSGVYGQAMLKITGTSDGSVSFSPIPLLGVAVGFHLGNDFSRLNILSGMTPVDLSKYAYYTGDPTFSGLTYTWASLNGVTQDPCPGSDSLSGSVYTTCPAFDGVTPRSGRIKVTANANPSAYTYIYVMVMPHDSAGTLRLDTGGAGGCVGTTPNVYSFVSGTPCTGSGVNWVSDYPYTVTNSITHQTSPHYLGGAGAYPRWYYANCPSAAAPLSSTSEGCLPPGGDIGTYPSGNSIYASFYDAPEITYTLIVPNGNYNIRWMGGSSGYYTTQNRPPTTQSSNMVFDTQDYVQDWAYCMSCKVNMLASMPVDVSVPALVINNVLEIGARTYNPYHWIGYSQGSHGTANAGFGVSISGMVLSPDTKTVPHWELGSYLPNAAPSDFQGDQFTVQPNNKNIDTVNGAPPPGVLQMYVKRFFTNDPPATDTGVPTPDPVWSIVSGPGTISSSGLYIAPISATAENGCAIVQAKSASNSYIARHQVCIAASGSFDIR